MANNYKVKMKDIQNKYKFKIFCAGYEYDDTELRNAINQRALITEAGRYIELELNPSTYVLTAKLKDKNNNVISTSTQIDLPLESMIVDCDYDEETKSLIITLQNGNTTSIPLGDLISGLVTEEDLEEVKSQVEINSMLENALPHVSGTGTSITLNNTAKYPMKNVLNPSELSQDTTTGANLQKFNARTTTYDSATYTCSDIGQVTITGTINTGHNVGWGYNLSSTNPMSLTAGTYTIKLIGTKSSNTNIELNGTTVITFDSNQEYTLTLTSDTTTFYLLVRGVEGTHNDNFYITLASGTTATTERYTGGIPQPNPTYPSDIHVISGDNSIVVQNKNLLDLSEITEANADKTYNNDGFWAYKLTNVLGTYTLSRENNTMYSSAGYVAIGQGTLREAMTNKVWLCHPSVQVLNTKSKTVTNTNELWLFLGNSATSLSNTLSYIGYLQLEFGSSSTDYVPHEEQVKPLNLGDLEYCRIGTYKDNFFKAVDGDEIYDSLDDTTKTSLTSGKWYMFKRLPKKVLDGSENIYDGQVFGNYFRVYAIISDLLKPTQSNTDVYANYFKGDIKALSSSEAKPGMMAVYTERNYLYMVTSETSVVNFKTWLSTHNTIVYYPSETPTYILLNDTLQQQLDDIYNLMLSYQGQTNISQVNNDLPFEIISTALYDLNDLLTRVAILETD